MTQTLSDRAAALDAADPLASLRDEFVTGGDVVAYLDGNSLGRPLRVTAQHLADFVEHEWGGRLIRGWDERWMQQPLELGDRLGRAVLGAAAGQTVVADSTTVMLYKLIRAGVAARAGRTEIVVDTENFPTDRFIVESIAAECGLEVRHLEPDPRAGVTAAQLADVVSERTALVVLSHVAYKSAYVADVAAITAVAHAAGALVLWDLCHSAGAVEVRLDAHEVDLAVGCSYKFLNGGPGAPAFGYVAKRLQDSLTQPITGWMGHEQPFDMGPVFVPSRGMRRFISGTPPILAMLPVIDMLELIERAGMAAVRRKSLALTGLAVDAAQELLVPLCARIASPLDPDRRGAHVTVEHERMEAAIATLWAEGILPDFRRPNGLRIGLSPLSTSFAEVVVAMTRVADLLA